MANITYRCELCSSEILASRRLPAPHVCVLCQLSAEEAIAQAEDEDPRLEVRYHALHPGTSQPRIVGL